MNLIRIVADPKQMTNLINDNLPLARELHRTLLRFMEETNVAAPLVETRRELRI